MFYPKDQITVIDAYYKGINGWTYSHTLLDDKEVSLDVNDTYEDLYLTRVLAEDPNPQREFLKYSIHDTLIAKNSRGEKLEYDFSKDKDDSTPLVNPDYLKSFVK